MTIQKACDNIDFDKIVCMYLPLPHIQYTKVIIKLINYHSKAVLVALKNRHRNVEHTLQQTA